MTEAEIEIAASIGAIKTVLMSLLVAQAVEAAGPNVAAIRAHLDAKRDNVLSRVTAGTMDTTRPEMRALLERVLVQIRTIFDNLHVD